MLASESVPILRDTYDRGLTKRLVTWHQATDALLLKNRYRSFTADRAVETREGQSMQEWQQLGEHGYRIERDLLRWKNEGMLLPEEVAGMMRLFQEMHAQHGYCLMLAPTGDQQQKPEVRRAFVDFFRQHADIRISVALHGGGAVTRAAVMLALGALRMTGAMRHIHLSFFPSVAAAEAWLLAERQHWLNIPIE